MSPMSERATELYAWWRHEDEIANHKIETYILTQTILVMAYTQEVTSLFATVGIVTSIIWIFSISRTVAYRDYWKKKLGKPGIHPNRKNLGKFPWHSKVSSKLILFGTPIVGFALWTALIVIYYVAPHMLQGLCK